MADSFASKLQLWEGWATASVEMPALSLRAEAGASRAPPVTEPPDILFAREAFSPRRRSRQGAEPFSLQWYLDAENARHARQGSWMPRLLEFVKHRSETLLAIGGCLGSDWVQYARNGAEVIACHPDAAALAIVQRNFELRGLRARFLRAQPASLPLETAAIEIGRAHV